MANILSLLKSNTRYFIVSVFFSLIFAYLLDILFLQSPTLTKFEVAVVLALFLITLSITFFLLIKFFVPAFARNPHRLALVIGSVLIAFCICRLVQGLAFDWRWVPNQTISVVVLSEKNGDSSGNNVSLLSLETNFGILSYSEIAQSGGWSRTAVSALENMNKSGETLTWSGRPGAFVKFTFATGPDSGIVRIQSNKGDETVDLYSPEKGEVTWESQYQIPSISYMVPLVAIWIVSFCLILFLSPFLFPFSQNQRAASRYYWLLFTLPMILIWGLYLLSFWPGELSPDSLSQWGQVLTGSYTDAHPPLYAFVIWLVTRIWASPGAVVLVQILGLSFAAAWGIKVFVDHGLNTFGAWFIASVFALSPINSTLVITLWKDIPYATVFLIFSIQFLQIIFSDGKWLLKWQNCLALALASLGIMLFRLNGLPVPILSLLIAILFFRKYWLQIGIVALTVSLSWVIIHGPVYDWIGVDKATGFENAVFIHHIAAHVVTGGPLTEEERQMVDLILPVQDWQYDCCNMITTYNAPNFDAAKTSQYTPQIENLFLSLAIKEPQIEWKHTMCVSGSLFKFGSKCGYWVSNIISQNTIITKNSYGIVPDSKIPAVNNFLTYFYKNLYNAKSLRVYWFSIIYLVLTLIAAISLTFWLKFKKGILFFVPTLIQTTFLFFTNVSSYSFRYQYGVFVLGIMSIGVIIMAINKKFQFN